MGRVDFNGVSIWSFVWNEVSRWKTDDCLCVLSVREKVSLGGVSVGGSEYDDGGIVGIVVGVSEGVG